MNFSIKTTITIDGEVDLEILDKAISPENVTMPEESGFVHSKINGNSFESKIVGKMSIGRLINTIDDILKTAILAKNVSKQTSELSD